MQNPSKILILRLSSMGDVILTTPLVRAVRERFPQAEIAFLVKQEFAELLRYNPRIDRLITFDKSTGFGGWRAVKAAVRQERFDWVIDLHKNPRTLFLRAGLGAGAVTTYSKRFIPRTLLVCAGVNLFRDAPPVLKRYFEAAAPAGIGYDGLGTEVFLAPQAEERAERLLAEAGREGRQPVAAVCPGASFSNKRWLPERFAQVADDLAARGCFVTLVGGPQDGPLCRAIIGAMGRRGVCFAGRLGLGESAALLKGSALAVTNDSGLMHLAQSQKTPVVAVFGPTTAELGYFPMPERVAVVERPVPCRPCTHNGKNYCPRGHFRCMREIDAEAVIAATHSLVSL